MKKKHRIVQKMNLKHLFLNFFTRYMKLILSLLNYFFIIFNLIFPEEIDQCFKSRGRVITYHNL